MTDRRTKEHFRYSGTKAPVEETPPLLLHPIKSICSCLTNGSFHQLHFSLSHNPILQSYMSNFRVFAWVTKSLSCTCSARAQATLALLQMSTHFRVPACLYGSQTVCPTPVARASHVRTLINVNPFSCLCVRACLRNISGVATQAKLSGKLRNSTHTGKSSPFIYILYYDIQAYHQHHRLQSSGWTAHQRVTVNISTNIYWHATSIDCT